MKKLDQVNWGIIGVGDVCEHKSAPAMSKIPHSRLVAVMRRNGAKAEDYARRHNVPRWYDDADALLRDPDVNAIYIATPPDTHALYTEKAAAAGFPIYVEKPMARTYEECQRMIRICRKAEVPLYVAYYRRTLPQFLKIKQHIVSGKIGRVRLVDIRMLMPLHPAMIANSVENWRVDPKIAGGGYFYDLASHQLDYLDFLFGPIKEVRGLKTNQAGLYPAADIVSGSFIFENGIIGNGIWSFNAAKVARREEVTIVGEKGKIHFATFGKHQVDLQIDGERQQICTLPPPEHIQQHLIEQVVEALRGKRQEVVSTGESAARTNWVMEQFEWKEPPRRAAPGSSGEE